MRKLMSLLFCGLTCTQAIAGVCYIDKVEFHGNLKPLDGNILLYFMKIPKEVQQIPVQVKWAERQDYLVSDGEVWGWQIKNKSALVLHNNDEIHIQGGSPHDWCDLIAVITPEKRGLQVKATNLYDGKNQSSDFFVDAKEVPE